MRGDVKFEPFDAASGDRDQRHFEAKRHARWAIGGHAVDARTAERRGPVLYFWSFISATPAALHSDRSSPMPPSLPFRRLQCEAEFLARLDDVFVDDRIVGGAIGEIAVGIGLRQAERGDLQIGKMPADEHRAFAERRLDDLAALELDVASVKAFDELAHVRKLARHAPDLGPHGARTSSRQASVSLG